MLQRLFWPLLALLWLLSTAADRLWLGLDQRLPSWDQADYLNSALDHGRALGLVLGGGWQGWQALLDLSPKIPPLASLVNGTVLALAGDHPDQASWALALWFGLLLLGVALWGRQLGGAALGLLAALACVLAPGLAELRVDFVLEIPLCAGCVWALWLLGRWQRPEGGRWLQALWAAAAIAAALLIKQSALLVLLLPALWAGACGLAQRRRRWQVLAALGLVLALVMPWLLHNLISVVSGTNRATLESAAREGDPNATSLAGWLWYPQRLPGLIGWLPLLLGGAGGLVYVARGWRRPNADDRWLLGSFLAGWLFTSLSPNKDPRYIAPLLPLLALLLARGWQQLWAALPPRWGTLLLGGGLVAAAGVSAAERRSAIEPSSSPPQPLEAIVSELQADQPNLPRTLIVVPSRPELNQHNVSFYGRRRGGQLVGRQLGGGINDRPAALAQAQLVLLATGDQGSVSRNAAGFSAAIRASGVFRLQRRWPRPEGGSYELWVRRADAARPQGFERLFPALAAGLAKGPAGLPPLFDAVGLEHQLDGHRQYQPLVKSKALAQLRADPNNREALWSLGLLAVLANRPLQADHWFAQLQPLEPANPWPAAYRAVVLTAALRPWAAHGVAAAALQQQPQQPVLRGLAELTAVLGGGLNRLPAARESLPAAVRDVEQSFKPPEAKR